MTNDKDSAVLDSGLEAAIHKAEFIYNEICRFGYGDLRRTVLDHVEQLTALRQPTQSDALREENERLRGIVYHYVDPFDIRPEDKDFVEATIAAALQEQSK